MHHSRNHENRSCEFYLAVQTINDQQIESVNTDFIK